MKKLFTTSRDRQDVVRIVVCQGESRRLDNNTVIGDLVLQNLPPRPRGETSIEVTFALDASGVLHVRARDPQTGTEQRATLALVGGVRQEGAAASRDRLRHLGRCPRRDRRAPRAPRIGGRDGRWALLAAGVGIVGLGIGLARPRLLRRGGSRFLRGGRGG